jgi:hypothetical protein
VEKVPQIGDTRSVAKASTDPCRLCSGRLEPLFHATVLEKYPAVFFRCANCGSLQTERPYWLDEAYRSSLASSDTGAVYRNLRCHAALVAVARLLRVRGAFIDYGGGAGLLCRLLRDSGFDAYLWDKYAQPVYAQAFVCEPSDIPGRAVGLVSAIEVLEHSADPAMEVGALFAVRPHVIFATTVLYRGEGSSWWYLGRGAGQHVFFYSPEAMRWLAVRYGYGYTSVDAFHIFYRDPVSRWRRALLRLLLSKLGLRALGALIAATRTGGFADADFRELCRRSGSGTEPKSPEI